MESWFSDLRTIATAGGLAQRIDACVGISGSTLDSIEMVLGKERCGYCGFRNLRIMSSADTGGMAWLH